MDRTGWDIRCSGILLLLRWGVGFGRVSWAGLGLGKSASRCSPLRSRSRYRVGELGKDILSAVDSWRVERCDLDYDFGPSVDFEDTDNSGKHAAYPFYE
jgi:hypothetical protein